MGSTGIGGVRLRRFWVLLAVVGVILASPAIALAARSWTLSAAPSTMAAGEQRTVSLTVTNTGGSGGGDEMTCVRVTVPASYTITAASITSIRGQTSGPAKQAWEVVWPGGQLVVFKNPADNYPLVGSSPPDDRAVFTITGVAPGVGTMTWSSVGFDKAAGSGTTDCGSGQFPTLQSNFTVTAPSTPAPTVVPSPTATPRVTPAPTPRASVSPTSPVPTPATSATPTPPQPTASGSVPPGWSQTPRPTPTDPAGSGPPSEPALPWPTPHAARPDVLLPPGQGPGGPAASEGSAFVPSDSVSAATSLAAASLGDIAMLFVPAAPMAVPGLLVILWVILQMIGGAAWLPAVRSMLGSERRARRRAESG